jgi:hypothetical protein
MKTIAENLYARGKSGMTYCRIRIPRALLDAYPKKTTHIVRSLGTSDVRQAKQRLKAEFTALTLSSHV